MKESIEKRISLVKESDDKEHLIKHLCPFYQKGGHPDCITCPQNEDKVLECKEYYLSRIVKIPMDIWEEDFDRNLVQARNKLPMSEIVGIGINCDSCYMYDKCPLFKAGYECAINWEENRPETPEKFYDFMINTQYERVRRASVFEKVDGGVPDAGLSGEIDRLNGLVMSKVNVNRERFSLNIEASSPASGGGGILAQLFGGGKKELPTAELTTLPEKTPETAIEEAVVIESTRRKERVRR